MVLEAGFANPPPPPPLIFWEASKDPKAREDIQEPPSWVLLDRIRGPAGDTEGGGVFGSEASCLVIMKAFRRAARRKLRF